MAADLHPVKQETFDTAANINTDPKGFLREVDTFRVTDFGLYTVSYTHLTLPTIYSV